MSAGEALTSPGVAPRYEPIDRELEASLLSEAIGSNSEVADTDSPYVLLTLRGDSPYANIARSLECRVFNEYFKNHPDVMAKEYGPYEESSEFFLLVHKEELEPAGVMRIIHDSDAGFKSVNDLPTDKCSKDGQPVTSLDRDEIISALDVSSGNTLDVATIAAHPKYGEKSTGSPLVLASLMRAVYKYSLNNGCDDLVAIIDAVPLEKLRAVNLPISELSEVAKNFEYLGAKGNSFIHIPIGEVEESVSSQSRELFDYIFGEAELMGECRLSLDKQ